MSTKPFLLGLTGSIGMGKSTTAEMFSEAGVPVWDADAAVHRLYQKGGAGVAAMQAVAPEVILSEAVSREKLRDAIARDPNLLARVERAIHPLVAADRQEFIKTRSAAEILLFDIPLLYETGADDWLDAVVVVTAPPEVQKERVLSRPGMTEDRFEHILGLQTPDAEKRRRADFLVETDAGLQAARERVRAIMERIGAEPGDA